MKLKTVILALGLLIVSAAGATEVIKMCCGAPVCPGSPKCPVR